MCGFLWVAGHDDGKAPHKFPKFPQGGSTAPTENHWMESVFDLGTLAILGGMMLCLVGGGSWGHGGVGGGAVLCIVECRAALESLPDASSPLSPAPVRTTAGVCRHCPLSPGGTVTLNSEH